MEAIVLARSCSWRSHAHVLGIGDCPSPLPRLDRFIFTPQAPFEAAITLRTFFIAFFLLFFAKPQ